MDRIGKPFGFSPFHKTSITTKKALYPNPVHIPSEVSSSFEEQHGFLATSEVRWFKCWGGSNMARAKKDTPLPDDQSEPKDVPVEFVQKAAYFHWEKRGKPNGDEWYDWLEAEKEIKEWMTASGLLPPKKNPKK
jgi:hypothetical protein